MKNKQQRKKTHLIVLLSSLAKMDDHNLALHIDVESC